MPRRFSTDTEQSATLPRYRPFVSMASILPYQRFHIDYEIAPIVEPGGFVSGDLTFRVMGCLRRVG